MKKLTTLFFVILTAVCTAQQPVITLQQLWQEAEQNSRLIKVKQTALLSAEQGVTASRSSMLPDVEVSANVGYLGDGLLTDRNFKNSLHIDNPHFLNGFSASASQLVYGGGVVKNAVKAAETGRDIAALDLENERQSVRLMIASYYLDICRMHNQMAVLDDNLNLCNVLIANMKEMEKQGTALANDILRYELQCENIILSKRRVNDALSTLYRRIATATGREGANDFLPDTSLYSMPVEMLADSVWQSKTAENIAVQMAQGGVTLKEHELKIAKSGMLPKVALVAEDNFSGPITIEVPVIDKNFNYWFVGVGVSYNISSLYKNKRDIRKSEIELEVSKERHRLAVEQTGDEIFAAYTDLMTSQAEIETQAKNVELARRNYNVILSRYNNGLAAVTDMLDAANTKLDTELSLVNSKINLLHNYFRLNYLSGKL